MTRKEIIKRAEDFCTDNKIEDCPVKIVDLCQKFGITVFEERLPNNVSGFIVYQEENFRDYNIGKLICVNSNDMARKRRLTIARELSHFLLYKEIDAPNFAHRYAGEEGKREREAELFALNVLMPKELVLDTLACLKCDCPFKLPLWYKSEYIAQTFCVSPRDALKRLSMF